MSRPLAIPPPLAELLSQAQALLGGPDGYLVGGSLRDLSLGRPPADIDLAVAGDAGTGGAPAFARALADRLGGHYVLLDEERGTARVVFDAGPVRYLDVAQLRGAIETDLAARDVTVDAMALPLANLDAALIDPHGGLDDLRQRTVRLVSEQALVDDPLRLLRAVRLAAELDFTIAPESAEFLRRHAGRIGQAAAERQRDELARCFATPRAAQAVRLLDDLGLLAHLLPEVTAGRGVTQPKEHYYDVFGHAVETVATLDAMLSTGEPAGEREAAFWHVLWQALPAPIDVRAYLNEELSEGRPRAALLKLAGLLHDVAKPETRAPDATGRVRFFGHAELGAQTAHRILRRLRFSRREIDFVAALVEEHLRPGQLGQSGPPSRRALYRFYRDAGEAAEGILLLSLADHLAARGPLATLDAWAQHVAYVAHVLARRHEDEAIVRPPRLLTGHDVTALLSIAPGPEVGRLLAALEEALAAGDVTTSRDEAIAFVRRLHGTGVGPRPVVAGGRG